MLACRPVATGTVITEKRKNPVQLIVVARVVILVEIPVMVFLAITGVLVSRVLETAYGREVKESRGVRIALSGPAAETARPRGVRTALTVVEMPPVHLEKHVMTDRALHMWRVLSAHQIQYVIGQLDLASNP